MRHKKYNYPEININSSKDLDAISTLFQTNFAEKDLSHFFKDIQNLKSFNINNFSLDNFSIFFNKKILANTKLQTELFEFFASKNQNFCYFYENIFLKQENSKIIKNIALKPFLTISNNNKNFFEDCNITGIIQSFTTDSRKNFYYLIEMASLVENNSQSISLFNYIIDNKKYDTTLSQNDLLHIHSLFSNRYNENLFIENEDSLLLYQQLQNKTNKKTLSDRESFFNINHFHSTNFSIDLSKISKMNQRSLLLNQECIQHFFLALKKHLDNCHIFKEDLSIVSMQQSLQQSSLITNVNFNIQVNFSNPERKQDIEHLFSHLITYAFEVDSVTLKLNGKQLAEQITKNSELLTQKLSPLILYYSFNDSLISIPKTPISKKFKL